MIAGSGPAEPAPAKLNLTLRVLGRRPDGYHALDSLVIFLDLTDRVWLEPATSETTVAFFGPFAADPAALPFAATTLGRAWTAWQAMIGPLPPAQIRVEKQIPAGGGLGGGSADAAALLRLLARAQGLDPADPRLLPVALAVGADVPACLATRPLQMSGLGEHLRPLPRWTLPEGWEIRLLHPGFGLSTAEIFRALAAPPLPAEAEVPAEPEALPQQVDALNSLLVPRGNDLEPPARRIRPELDGVLDWLAAGSPWGWARMTGSGACCFAFGPQGAPLPPLPVAGWRLWRCRTLG